MRTSEIKLQLNNAAGGRQLTRNKILFYFRRPHILDIKPTKTLKQPETVLAFVHPETEIKRNCRLSTVGWNAAPTVGSFVLIQFYFTMCDELYIHVLTDGPMFRFIVIVLACQQFTFFYVMLGYLYFITFSRLFCTLCTIYILIIKSERSIGRQKDMQRRGVLHAVSWTKFLTKSWKCSI